MKMLAYCGNVGAFIEMLEHYWHVGALLKCWRPIEMLGLYWNIGPLFKRWRLIEMLATWHVKICHQLFKLTVSLLFGLAKLHSDQFSSALAGGSSLSLEGVVPSMCCCWESVPHTGRQLPPLSSVLYRIISKRLAAQLLLREKSGA